MLVDSLRPKTGSYKPDNKRIFDQAIQIEKISTFNTGTGSVNINNPNSNDYFNSFIDSKFNTNFALGKLFNLNTQKENKPILVNKNTSTSENNSNFNLEVTENNVNKK